MMDDRAFLQDFAGKHKVIFDDEGECGFGRECVGLSRDGQWVEYDPVRHLNNDPWEEEIEGFDANVCHGFYPPKEVGDAYHKHDCCAVLVLNDNYDEAIRQLAIWVRHMVEGGEVEVASYDNHPTNAIEAMMHGPRNWAFRRPT